MVRHPHLQRLRRKSRRASASAPKSLDMKDKIFQVLVPKEKMIEIKNGKRRVVEKRIFQGYVLVQMKMS
jgi:transcription antitermination factor NusG